MVMVKKECLQRPIINTVCNVDMGVFNLSLSLCLYLSSSVSLWASQRLRLCQRSLIIRSHRHKCSGTLSVAWTHAHPPTCARRSTAAHIHVHPRYREARTLPPRITCRTQTPHNGLFPHLFLKRRSKHVLHMHCSSRAIMLPYGSHTHCFISSRDFFSPDVVSFRCAFQFFE